MIQAAIFCAAFLLGSIPFGLIFAKGLSGKDPRKSGSGNIGFTNVLRVSGKIPGFLTLFGDVMKGFLAVRLAQGAFQGGGLETWLSALLAVLGHNYSVFLGFRGGKGVATGFGVVFGLQPLTGVLLAGIWGLTVLLWRYSSLGAIASFLVFPFIAGILEKNPQAFVFSLLISAIILYKHSGNLSRLRKGTEPRIGQSR